MSVSSLHATLDSANPLLDRGEYDVVHRICDEVERAATADTTLTEPERTILHIRTLKVKGDALSSAGDHDAAVEVLSTALQLAERAHNADIMAMVLLSLGSNEFRRLRYADMIGWLMRAAERSDDIRDQALLAGVYCNLGVAWFEIGDFAKALEWYEKALPLAESAGHLAFLANICNNLGNIYLALEDQAASRTYHERCLSLALEIDDTESIGNSYFHLAGIARSSGDQHAAVELYERALTSFRTMGDQGAIALTMSSIGSVVNDQKQSDRALTLKRQALESLSSIDDPVTEATILHDMALILIERNASSDDLVTAEGYLRRSIELNTALDAKQRLAENYLQRENLHALRAEWQLAYEAAQMQRQLTTTIRSEAAMTNARMLEHRRTIESNERDRQLKLARFQEQERIFHNILPESIADRLIDGETTIAETFDHVSIFFSDIVGFTTLASQISATDLVNGLNRIFSEFDRLAVLHGLEKIKTIGDAYMAVCGVPVQHEDHAHRVARFALDVRAAMEDIRIGPNAAPVQIRIGLHTGSVVAGVIGTQKFAYDLWGDAVNVASRMESSGEAGRIHVSEAFALQLEKNQQSTIKNPILHEVSHAVSHASGPQSELVTRHSSLVTQLRGSVDIKGKGPMRTYWLDSSL